MRRACRHALGALLLLLPFAGQGLAADAAGVADDAGFVAPAGEGDGAVPAPICLAKSGLLPRSGASDEPTTGKCCKPGEDACIITTPEQCAELNGCYAGDGTDCDSSIEREVPEWPALPEPDAPQPDAPCPAGTIVNNRFRVAERICCALFGLDLPGNDTWVAGTVNCNVAPTGTVSVEVRIGATAVTTFNVCPGAGAFEAYFLPCYASGTNVDVTLRNAAGAALCDTGTTI